jgi:hypothetical protein
MGEECEGTDRYLEEGEGEEAGETVIDGQGVRACNQRKGRRGRHKAALIKGVKEPIGT